MIELDHLAVAAETLEEGRELVEAALGVRLQTGGQHAHFGTHNLLLGLEDDLYLEVITIDPSAPKPAFPRWFDLDRFQGAPRLQTWICRTDDIETFCGACPHAGIPVSLARGDLRWQMAVPETGILPYDSCFPAVIEWQGYAHPAARLSESGVRLKRLQISHPEALQLSADLEAIFRDPRVRFEAGARAMRAEFETPHGLRVLE